VYCNLQEQAVDLLRPDVIGYDFVIILSHLLSLTGAAVYMFNKNKYVYI